MHEWKQQKICVGLAYSTHNVAYEDKHQFLEERGVGIGGHETPIAREGGIVSLS